MNQKGGRDIPRQTGKNAGRWREKGTVCQKGKGEKRPKKVEEIILKRKGKCSGQEEDVRNGKTRGTRGKNVGERKKKKGPTKRENRGGEEGEKRMSGGLEKRHAAPESRDEEGRRKSMYGTGGFSPKRTLRESTWALPPTRVGIISGTKERTCSTLEGDEKLRKNSWRHSQQADPCQMPARRRCQMGRRGNMKGGGKEPKGSAKRKWEGGIPPEK